MITDRSGNSTNPLPETASTITQTNSNQLGPGYSEAISKSSLSSISKKTTRFEGESLLFAFLSFEGVGWFCVEIRGSERPDERK
jgi:hypothetical protein